MVQMMEVVTKRIKKIRRELAESPNGWPLCVMVGAEYTNNRAYRKMRDA